MTVWTAPKTWVKREKVASAVLNAQLRDNMLWLAERGLTPTSDLDGTVGSTSSGTFTDMGNSFAITTVKANAKVLIVCWGTATQGNSVDTYNLTIDVDGVNQGHATRGCLQLGAATGTTYTFNIAMVVNVASAAPHTVKLQAKRSAGTSSGITITAMHLWAWELA